MAPRYLDSRVGLVIFTPPENSGFYKQESGRNFEIRNPQSELLKKFTVSGVRFQVSGKRNRESET
jgi:hypothetical protein